jgi:hypothetical protein
MNVIPHTPETDALSKRVVWFEPPEKALADPIRFMAYVMAHATPEDIIIVRRYLTDDDFREALDKARRPASSIHAPGRIGIRSSGVIRHRRCHSGSSDDVTPMPTHRSTGLPP